MSEYRFNLSDAVVASACRAYSADQGELPDRGSPSRSVSVAIKASICLETASPCGCVPSWRAEMLSNPPGRRPVLRGLLFRLAKRANLCFPQSDDPNPQHLDLASIHGTEKAFPEVITGMRSKVEKNL